MNNFNYIDGSYSELMQNHKSDVHGFTIFGITTRDKYKAEVVALSLLNSKIATCYPETVIYDAETKTESYVYPEGASFDSAYMMFIYSKVNTHGMLVVSLL